MKRVPRNYHNLFARADFFFTVREILNNKPKGIIMYSTKTYVYRYNNGDHLIFFKTIT